jgi:sigma-54 dependent transcriptional regulator, acetoin dehydrogenase operon transcriptional activator AcoR
VSPEPGTVPAGREAWRRTLQVRERFLAAGDPDRLPPATCGVRREIVLSWRRSLLSGVDPAGTDLPRDEQATPPERLLDAARPVVDRLAGQLAGMPVWSFLADRECRLVRYVVGDRALIPQLEARGAVPGARFGEDMVGTNGLGTAVERQQPFIVAGSEHFRAHESEATTVGAPVRDPVTGRLVGLLNVNCPYPLTNGLLVPFISEFARSIEARLLAQGSAASRAMLEELLRVSRRYSLPAVAVSGDLLIATTAAVRILDGTDHELLRQWARGGTARCRERTTTLHLTGDRAVTARRLPLSEQAGRGAALVILAPGAEPPARTRPADRSFSRERLLGQLEKAAAARLPVLVTGERGTGKTLLARGLHERAAASGQLTVLDAADHELAQAEWTSQLRAALADPRRTVLLRHLDCLRAGLAGSAARLAQTAQARLVATATGPGARHPALAALTEQFPVVLYVPPLRDRRADVPALIDEIIAELRPEFPRPRCSAQALAVLADSAWPGNVRQLRQVIATALVRSMSGDIMVDDLPAGYAGAGWARAPSRLEQAERQALLDALRDAEWDREAAARDLGISRATIYRKLRQHGIGARAVAGRNQGGTDTR